MLILLVNKIIIYYFPGSLFASQSTKFPHTKSRHGLPSATHRQRRQLLASVVMVTTPGSAHFIVHLVIIHNHSVLLLLLFFTYLYVKFNQYQVRQL